MSDITNTQKNADLTIKTPLGDDGLLLDSLYGTETISQPFEFVLNLRSKSTTVDFKSLIGKEVTVTLNFRGDDKRYFSGVVGEISQGQTKTDKDIWLTHYQAKIYPTLWLLKFASDCRIFQNKTALDIIKAIFSDNNLTSFTDKTSKRGQTQREYCVQYNETAFDFVSRLMEEEGICYFFEHSASGHKLILSDANSTFTKQPKDAIPLIYAMDEAYHYNAITYCELHQQVVPKKFSTGDYNYELSTTPMRTTTAGDGAGGEIYRFPGVYKKNNEGEKIGTERIEELEWAKNTLQGKSTSPLLTSGYQFDLKDHPRSDANKSYVAYQVKHKIDIQAVPIIYENEFIAFDNAANFSPPILTKKPRIHGTQTAIVTGKQGEEIWTDKYGRVCVQFHWDRLGQSDEKSSLMIRVAQGWAMGGWGILFTPRIGQEVVVSFIDGDPDRPLITGCVYNCANLPPYLPGEPTKSTIKSNSSKGNDGYNEFRIEDKKGSEQIYVQAQKDMDRLVKNARTLIIQEGNDTETLNKGSRNITLKSESGAVKHTLTITKGDDEITLSEGNLKITLSKGDATFNITGNETHTVSDSVTVKAKSITLKADADITIDAGGSLTLKSGEAMTMNAKMALNIKSGMDTMLQSGTMLTMKGTASAILDGGPMVTVKGAGTAMIQGGMLTLQGNMVMMG